MKLITVVTQSKKNIIIACTFTTIRITTHLFNEPDEATMQAICSIIKLVVAIDHKYDMLFAPSPLRLALLIFFLFQVTSSPSVTLSWLRDLFLRSFVEFSEKVQKRTRWWRMWCGHPSTRKPFRSYSTTLNFLMLHSSFLALTKSKHRTTQWNNKQLKLNATQYTESTQHIQHSQHNITPTYKRSRLQKTKIMH